MDVIMTCILSSTLVATLITAIKEVILWVLSRRAKVADDEREDSKEDYKSELSNLSKSIQTQNEKYDELLEKLSEHITLLETSLNKLTISNKLLLKDRIEYIALSYIEKGKISYSARKNLHDLWDVYHYEFGGNGDLDDIMSRIDHLPLDL